MAEVTVSVILAEVGEKKNVLFLFRDRHKDPVNINTGWTFEAVAYNATTRLFTKTNIDFDVATGGEDGELRMPTEFTTAGQWKLMLTASYGTTVVLKPKFMIVITEEAIPNS